jgi:hypothetical protein
LAVLITLIVLGLIFGAMVLLGEGGGSGAHLQPILPGLFQAFFANLAPGLSVLSN